MRTRDAITKVEIDRVSRNIWALYKGSSQIVRTLQGDHIIRNELLHRKIEWLFSYCEKRLGSRTGGASETC